MCKPRPHIGYFRGKWAVIKEVRVESVDWGPLWTGYVTVRCFIMVIIFSAHFILFNNLHKFFPLTTLVRVVTSTSGKIVRITTWTSGSTIIMFFVLGMFLFFHKYVSWVHFFIINSYVNVLFPVIFISVWNFERMSQFSSLTLYRVCGAHRVLTGTRTHRRRTARRRTVRRQTVRRQTVRRQDSLPTGQCADRTVRRQDSSPTGWFADRTVGH